jgi:diaminopimelate decarboxylase
MADYSVAARLALFPVSACLAGTDEGEHLSVAGHDLNQLAEEHGTPLYVYDQATLDVSTQRYRQALLAHYPGETGITYAGKAFLCVAMAQWVERRGLWLDCTGVGELAIAAAAGVGRKGVVVHGVNKSWADLEAALAQAGTIVVDNLAELDRLAGLARRTSGVLPNLWLRTRPGCAVDTHAHNQTGQEDSKFGMEPAEISDAVKFCLQQGLPVCGLHFHLGSQFHDAAPLGLALDRVLDLTAALRTDIGWVPQVLCPGGGWGVAYHEEEAPHPPVEEYVRFLAHHLVAACGERGLPLPRLQLEPGRGIVAQAGVALYRVGACKTTTHRRWLLLDGGLADNPRPALYGAQYTALPAWHPSRPTSGAAWLAGPYCESGDVLIEALPLPDVHTGELLAVPVSGAYQLALASNYNGACRPPVLWLTEGNAHLVRERERVASLAARDHALWPNQDDTRTPDNGQV